MTSRVTPIELLQITLVVHDLAETERAFREAYGLRVAFRDPGVGLWGLDNSVLPMGDRFIELLSPHRSESARANESREDTEARLSKTPGGRHLLRQGGDSGYMVILKVPTLEPWRAALARENVRIAWEGETADTEHGANWSGFHLHPADTGGMMISLDRPDPPDSWAGAGPDWRDFVVQDVVDDLLGIELRSDDPEALAARWAQTLGREVGRDGRIRLDRGTLGFRGARSDEVEGLAEVVLHASDRSRAGEIRTLGGVSFRLE